MTIGTYTTGTANTQWAWGTNHLTTFLGTLDRQQKLTITDTNGIRHEFGPGWRCEGQGGVVSWSRDTVPDHYVITAIALEQIVTIEQYTPKVAT